jgi:hypothetical protein
MQSHFNITVTVVLTDDYDDEDDDDDDKYFNDENESLGPTR